MLNLFLLAQGGGVGTDPIFGWTPLDWIWIVVIILIILFVFGFFTGRFRR